MAMRCRYTHGYEGEKRGYVFGDYFTVDHPEGLNGGRSRALVVE
jgi:hypothetical protein